MLLSYPFLTCVRSRNKYVVQGIINATRKHGAFLEKREKQDIAHAFLKVCVPSPVFKMSRSASLDSYVLSCRLYFEGGYSFHVHDLLANYNRDVLSEVNINEYERSNYWKEIDYSSIFNLYSCIFKHKYAYVKSMSHLSITQRTNGEYRGILIAHLYISKEERRYYEYTSAIMSKWGYEYCAFRFSDKTRLQYLYDYMRILNWSKKVSKSNITLQRNILFFEYYNSALRTEQDENNREWYRICRKETNREVADFLSDFKRAKIRNIWPEYIFCENNRNTHIRIVLEICDVTRFGDIYVIHCVLSLELGKHAIGQKCIEEALNSYGAILSEIFGTVVRLNYDGIFRNLSEHNNVTVYTSFLVSFKMTPSS